MNGYTKDNKELRSSNIPSKSQRLNSPNTSQWELDVRMMMSTNQWLKVCICSSSKELNDWPLFSMVYTEETRVRSGKSDNILLSIKPIVRYLYMIIYSDGQHCIGWFSCHNCRLDRHVLITVTILGLKCIYLCWVLGFTGGLWGTPGNNPV